MSRAEKEINRRLLERDIEIARRSLERAKLTERIAHEDVVAKAETLRRLLVIQQKEKRDGSEVRKKA